MFYYICAMHECLKCEPSSKLHRIMVLTSQFQILSNFIFNDHVVEHHTCHLNIYYHLPIPLYVRICNHLKFGLENPKTTIHILLRNFLTFCKMLLLLTLVVCAFLEQKYTTLDISCPLIDIILINIPIDYEEVFSPQTLQKLNNRRGSIKHIQVIITPKQPKINMLDP